MAGPQELRYDLPEDLEFRVRPVGVFRSPFTVHEGTPRQPRTGEARDGHVVIRHGYQNLLKDLDGFSHVWIVAWMSYARGWNEMVVPPRDPTGTPRGLFATRSPHRPNGIAISALELKGIHKRVLHVGAHDLLDGTPVLDVKPYVAYCDSIPDARHGWLDELGPDAGPDHRAWRNEPDR